MIHYQLRCADGHEFDGWFKDSAAFDQQGQLGLLECPSCGSSDVTRALMAPAVAKRESPARAEPPLAPVGSQGGPAGPAGPAAQVAATGRMPAHVLAMLQRLRAEVEKNCDYVGPGLAEEARKMHRGETEKRGIYGESTPNEAKELADEGIELSQIPWVPRADG